MTPSGNTLLITGGTSGIGRALAEKFHALGNKVIITGRRRHLLDEMIETYDGMSAYTLDVTDRDQRVAFSARVIADHPTLNVILNNAGIMRQEDLTDNAYTTADAEAMITTNLVAPMQLIAALLPHLKSQPNATIINVTSGLAFVPLVQTPTYSATKAALHSYTICLREQLRGAGIEVLELIPPGVQTEIVPSQADNPDMMPLDDFIAETMDLFQIDPTPEEICVERVNFLRQAEANGRFSEVLKILNDSH